MAKTTKTNTNSARAAVVALAQSWVGKKESDGSYKSIIDIYNGYKGELPRGIKMQYSWSWCACTWSAIAIKLGYTDVMPIEISCGNLVEAAKKMGCWVEADNYIPDPGDGILYDWDDSGKGDNTGWPDHIGIVEIINRTTGQITVIEGNYSNAVRRRNITVNARYIRGYIVPKYAPVETADKASSSTGTAPAGTICKVPQRTGTVTASSLNVRTWAGTNNPNIKTVPYLHKGDTVEVCDEIKAADGAVWYYVRINGKTYGFVHSRYVTDVG